MDAFRRVISILMAALALQTAPVTPAAPAASLTKAESWSDGSADFARYEIAIENPGPELTGWTLVLEGSAKITQAWNCAASGLTLTPAAWNNTIPAGGTLAGIGFIASGGSLRVRSLNGSEATSTAAEKPAAVPAGAAGKLHVKGTQLCDEKGSPVQLRGVSTHGLAWFPRYVSEETFRTLRDDWGANTVRLALYTAEYGGWCAGGDRAALRSLLDKGVQCASKLGMYVILDWHILSDGDPRTHQAEAVAFFTEFSQKYAQYPNVIYELCNEPNGAPWDTAIRPYAQAVLAAIRKNAPDAVVLVGTDTWSQDVDAVIGKQLDDPNVMYALHFYAATHKAPLRQKLEKALDAGVPVFVSECGISEASGNGSVDIPSANEWLSLLNRRGVSFIAWGLSNKAETASLLRPACETVSGWGDADLTESGKWFRTAIKSRSYQGNSD